MLVRKKGVFYKLPRNEDHRQIFKTRCLLKFYLINLKRSVKMIQSQRQTKFLHRPNLEILIKMEMDYFNPPQNLQVWKYMDCL